MDDYISEQWGEDVKVLRYKSKMDEFMEKLVAASGTPSPSLNTLLGGLGGRLKIQWDQEQEQMAQDSDTYWFMIVIWTWSTAFIVYYIPEWE